MYIRVIADLKRWKTIVNNNPVLLPADCFFDIKTANNTLSLWQVQDSPAQEELEDFTVISTLGRESIDKVSYICISDQELQSQGLEIRNDNPNCKYLNNDKTDFINHHFDIINIDCYQYQKIADLIRSKINKDELKILTKSSVLASAIRLFKNEILIKENLKDNIINKIESKL